MAVWHRGRVDKGRGRGEGGGGQVVMWTLQGVAAHTVASSPVHVCFTSDELTCSTSIKETGYSHECHDLLPDLIGWMCVLMHSLLSLASEDFQLYSSSYGWHSGHITTDECMVPMQHSGGPSCVSNLTMQTLLLPADAWIVLVWWYSLEQKLMGLRRSGPQTPSCPSTYISQTRPLC